MKSALLKASILCLLLLLLPCQVYSQIQPTVKPILHCITFDQTTRMADTYWGYVSTHTTPVTIGANDNFFYPGVLNRNQPTVFQPGIHDRVFFSSFMITPNMSQLTWSLDRNEVTATLDRNLTCNPPY